LLERLDRPQSAPEDCYVAVYNAACICSLASAEAKKDRELPDGEGAKRAEALTRQAIDLLCRLKEKTDFFKKEKNREHFLNDKDFRSLEQNADFLRFRKELEEMPGGR
jgi:hypothetical protein